MLAIAVVCAAVSTGLFLAAADIGLLIVARVVSGTAAGFATGTATAGLAELQPRGDRQAAAVVASGANMTVSGWGRWWLACSRRTWRCRCAVCSGPTWVRVRWRWPPSRLFPKRSATVIAGSASGRGWPFRPGLGAVMLGACLGVFAAFSVLGLFSSLVPTFLHGVLGVHNLALIGGGSFLIFVTAAVSQAVSARLARRSVSTGLPLLLVCLAALEAALFATALWLFLIGTITGGIAVGFIFRGDLQRAEPARRTAAPGGRRVHVLRRRVCRPGPAAVLTGLISLAVGPVDASVYVSCLAAAIVVVAFIVVRRAFGRSTAPSPPAIPCDSWCHPEEPVPVGPRDEPRSASGSS